MKFRALPLDGECAGDLVFSGGGESGDGEKNPECQEKFISHPGLFAFGKERVKKADPLERIEDQRFSDRVAGCSNPAARFPCSCCWLDG